MILRALRIIIKTHTYGDVKMKEGNSYKGKVTDEELIQLVSDGAIQATGDWLNSGDLSQERMKSTYEFAAVPAGHLAPQGVSAIVDSSTTETVEAYTAIICDLFLNNGKLARFLPVKDNPKSHKDAHQASMLTNYCLFKQNEGWTELQTWVKSALLWKNSIIRWDYVEDYAVDFEEYDNISQDRLDELLSDDDVEIVGDLQYEASVSTEGDGELTYVNVRLRRTIDKSKVKIENVAPEGFRISREATSLEDASFIGIETQLTRSEIRKQWPDIAENISEDEWNGMGDGDSWNSYSSEQAARKLVVGDSYQSNSTSSSYALEANREVTVTECWLKVDRDGDGIAELKHIVSVGTFILHEEDVDMVPLASLSPIDIPYEFYGLSIADMTRSSTLASTAILRGFVENTYLTNYSPKLADPNVVDFSALQNMKPKQIVPTNGNPNGAVAALPPETISTGTVPLMQHLQSIKEQATGMSKAAQGLNDSLYVSGNSESKVAAVQSASQKRIQHIARRFAETGLKRLSSGVYQCIRKNMNTVDANYQGIFTSIVPKELPRFMDCEIFIDLGENSNANKIKKLQQVGQTILPGLNTAGAGMIIKTEAPAVLATQLLEALGLDSSDFLEDYTTEEFKEKATQAVQSQTERAQKEQEIAQQKQELEMALSQSNITYTDAQTKNVQDDNAKQLAVSIDKSFQEWAGLEIKSVKEGAVLPARPPYDQVIAMAREILSNQGGQ